MTDPWELIVWENVAYLVDDERRAAAYRRLANEIGTVPDQILDAPPAKLLAAIADGGMLPEHRAEKLRKAARVALVEFDGDLADVARRPAAEAKRALRKFPGIGEPGAEKILMFARGNATLALESTGLRVVVRLGLSDEKKNYDATYRAAREALHRELVGVEDDYAWLIDAHQLLRRHGQELCKRSVPLCDPCPLRECCAYYAAHVSRRRA
jgi:endonuclease-3